MMLVRLSVTLLGLALLSSTAYAGKPGDPPPDDVPPPLPVLEKNLDDDGWIKVHEQGTAKVDIQNSSLDVNATIDNSELDVNVLNGPSDPVSVNVENFPPQQAAPMPTVTEWTTVGGFVNAGESKVFPFNALNAVSVEVGGVEGHDYAVEFLTGGASGDVVLDLDPETARMYFYPVPMDSAEIFCFNIVDPCLVGARILGFAAQP